MSNDLIILDGIIEEIKAEVAPNLSNDEYFELLLAEQVTKDYDLTYEQLEEGNPGGGHDGGIDSFHIFVNGMLIEDDTSFPNIKNDVNIHVIISQAKNKPRYEEEVINKLRSVSEDIFTLEKELSDFVGVYNDKLLETAQRFRDVYKYYAARFPNLKFSYYYGCRATSKPTDNIQRKANLLAEKMRSLFSPSECEFTFLGASDLLLLIRRKPKTTFELKLAENPIYPDGGTSFIGLAKLYDFFDFITDNKGNLIQHIFEANVRDWQGDNAVNKQILDTLKNPKGEDFWWLNNGITIVSTEADNRGGKITNIENPEIVNGLQTSRAVYDYFVSLKENGKNPSADNRHLLVRVIVPDEGESRDRIILATNSQTSIPLESLKSTEKIHRDIESHLLKSGIYYDRRKNYWRLQRKPFARIITIKKLAQAVLSIAKYQPDIAKASPSSIFRSDSDELYQSVFSPNYPIELYQLCASLIIRLEEILRSDAIQTELTPRAVSQVKFHALTHVVIRKTRNAVAVPNQIAKLDVSSFSNDLMIDSIQRVLDIFVKMGPNNITSKSSKFYQRVIDDAKSLI